METKKENERPELVTNMGERLENIMPKVNWGQIAYIYFKKDPLWLHYKMWGGDDKKGTVDGLTSEEVQTLRNALLDTAEIIRQAAERI